MLLPTGKLDFCKECACEWLVYEKDSQEENIDKSHIPQQKLWLSKSLKLFLKSRLIKHIWLGSKYAYVWVSWK